MEKKIQKKSTREIYFQNQERTPPFLLSRMMIWLHDVRSMHNVGSAFRTADAFGIKKILLTGYTPAPPRPEITKTALGAEENIAWEYHRNPFEIFQLCRKEKYPVIGIEQTRQSQLITHYKPCLHCPVCLLFGNEITGIDLNLLDQCELLLEIPQYGKKHSFNISVSIGITLYHFLSSSLP